MISFFANHYSPLKRGSNENLNILIRQYMPNKNDFKDYRDPQINEMETKTNRRPRKRHDYETAIFGMEKSFFNSEVAFVN